MTGIRIQQKLATRIRILAAARECFRHGSYDETGVREIAERAGVAAGTVIASFGSKAEVLTTLMIEDFAILQRLIAEAAAVDAPIAQRLHAMASACIGYQARQPGLLRASLAASWIQDADATRRVHEAMLPCIEIVTQELARGIEAGEIRQDLNLETAAIMLFECLNATYRIVTFTNGGQEHMQAGMAKRLNALLHGFLNPNSNVMVAQAA